MLSYRGKSGCGKVGVNHLCDEAEIETLESTIYDWKGKVVSRTIISLIKAVTPVSYMLVD